MERNKTIIMIILVCLIAISATRIAFYKAYIYDSRSVDMYATVVASSLNVGMDVSTDAIRFSTVPAGRQVTKFVNISFEKPTKVQITGSGELFKWINVTNYVYLEANETKTIDLMLIVPKDAKLGEYKGKIVFLFMRP